VAVRSATGTATSGDSRPAQYDHRGIQSPHYQANRPQQAQQPHYDNRATKPRDPTTANIRDERRYDKPITGEMDQPNRSRREPTSQQ
jgi:hypothetical protein